MEKEKEISIDDKTGTRITEEFDKTVFGNWIVTEPGQTNKIQFTYRLPFKLEPASLPSNDWKKILSPLGKKLANYQLVVQKQSGASSDFESQIIVPDDWSPVWRNGDNFVLASNGASMVKAALPKDKIWSILFKKK